MTNVHKWFLVNMTLEKPPWGKPVREIDIYIGDLKANATTSKYTRNLIQSKLLLKLVKESLKTCACLNDDLRPLLEYVPASLCLHPPRVLGSWKDVSAPSFVLDCTYHKCTLSKTNGALLHMCAPPIMKCTSPPNAPLPQA
jgi:hypothetical protein